MSEIDILSFGETMAMLVAEQTGDLAAVEHFHKRIAGADSNVAIGLSRLGFNVAWLSRVGADSLGRFVVQTLIEEGLDCSHVAVDDQHPTGFQFNPVTTMAATHRSSISAVAPRPVVCPYSRSPIPCSAPVTCTPPGFHRHCQPALGKCRSN